MAAPVHHLAHAAAQARADARRSARRYRAAALALVPFAFANVGVLVASRRPPGDDHARGAPRR